MPVISGNKKVVITGKRETNSNGMPANKSISGRFLTGRLSTVFLLIILVLAISFLTRVALLIKTGKNFDLSFSNITGSFAFGTFFDLAMAFYLIIPFIFQIWLANEKMYYKLYAIAA